MFHQQYLLTLITKIKVKIQYGQMICGEKYFSSLDHMLCYCKGETLILAHLFLNIYLLYGNVYMHYCNHT